MGSSYHDEHEHVHGWCNIPWSSGPGYAQDPAIWYEDPFDPNPKRARANALKRLENYTHGGKNVAGNIHTLDEQGRGSVREVADGLEHVGHVLQEQADELRAAVPEPEWDEPDACEPQRWPDSGTDLRVQVNGILLGMSEYEAKAVMTRLHAALGPLSPLGESDVQFVKRIRSMLHNAMGTLDLGSFQLAREEIERAAEELSAWYQPPSEDKTPPVLKEVTLDTGAKYTPLPHSLVVWAPRHLRGEVESMAMEVVGGFSQRLMRGGWVDDQGDHHIEVMAVVTMFSDKFILASPFVEKLHAAGEKAVLYMHDGKAHMSERSNNA
jgi:hypothetical protein